MSAFGTQSAVCILYSAIRQHVDSERKLGRFKVPGIASNILRNRSALVMGICTTFTCFQTLRPRKCGSLHETGFSLPRWYHFDGRSSSEPPFRLLEVEAKCDDTGIHTPTILDSIKWNNYPPYPPKAMMKARRSKSAPFLASLKWGKGWSRCSIYFVQDCIQGFNVTRQWEPVIRN